MRFSRFLLFVFVLLLCLPLGAQQIAATAPQAPATLQKAFGATVGTASIKDVTLTGTARRIAGSDDETGTAVLKALATGETRMDFSFPSGQRSEVRTNSGNVPAGQWSGPDGKPHKMSYHNLMTDSSWFFPALTLTRLVSSQGYVVSVVGPESRSGQAVEHLAVSQLASELPPDISAEVQHLSRMEVYLDSASGLPVALTFNIHPDNNALLDIPEEIRLSDYRVMNGAHVPFHVEQFLNNGLIYCPSRM